MPFNQLQRRDSWPPTIVRIGGNDADTSAAIDENPFPYFITAPEEFDEDLDDLGAGIESAHGPKPHIREVSPSSLQRRPLMDEDEDEDEDDEELRRPNHGFTVPFSLKDFTASQEARRETVERQRSVVSGSKGRATLEVVGARGRPTVRLTPARRGRGRGQTRSVPIQRPHSWRGPSPDVFSIPEERESGSDEDPSRNGSREKIMEEEERKVEPREMVSPPPPPPSPKPKPKKRVRWALPLRRNTDAF